jgi:hypothetical protein
VFRKTKSKDIPKVTPETLSVYREYLVEHITFPMVIQFKGSDVKISSLLLLEYK